MKQVIANFKFNFQSKEEWMGTQTRRNCRTHAQASERDKVSQHQLRYCFDFFRRILYLPIQPWDFISSQNASYDIDLTKNIVPP